MKRFKVGLFISDLHFPYHHPDCFLFLNALKKKYKPDWVGASGDERDHHAESFHDPHPDLYSAGMEHDCALLAIKRLNRLFPRLDLLTSNHGSLPTRKLIANRLTPKILKSYQERNEAPKWAWHQSLRMKSGDQEILFIHGHSKSANDMLLSQRRGVSIVQGHHHSKYSIQWYDTGLGPKFACTVGCLIDDSSKAFLYNKEDIQRPFLGVLLIEHGIPRLLPMLLDKRGKWTRQIP